MFRRLLVVLLPAVSLHAQGRTFRVPFPTARSLILVSVKVDGAPKTLIFDTGARRTLINYRDGNVKRRVAFSLGPRVIGNFRSS